MAGNGLTCGLNRAVFCPRYPRVCRASRACTGGKRQSFPWSFLSIHTCFGSRSLLHPKLEDSILEPLKNFSQAAIEQAIAGALSQLTGDRYSAEIKSKESVELSLAERNALAIASAFQTREELVTEREKITLVLHKVGR